MRALGIGAVTFLIDQLSKLAVSAALTPGQAVPLIPGFLSITLTRNPGASFGILPYQTPLLITVTLLWLGVVFFVFRERNHRPMTITGIGLAVGGAAGNLADRIRFGSVVDFLDLPFWPTFNLADAALVAGAALLAWDAFRDKEKETGREA